MDDYAEAMAEYALNLRRELMEAYKEIEHLKQRLAEQTNRANVAEAILIQKNKSNYNN